jgi:hypothetical protein
MGEPAELTRRPTPRSRWVHRSAGRPSHTGNGAIPLTQLTGRSYGADRRTGTAASHSTRCSVRCCRPRGTGWRRSLLDGRPRQRLPCDANVAPLKLVIAMRRWTTEPGLGLHCPPCVMALPKRCNVSVSAKDGDLLRRWLHARQVVGGGAVTSGPSVPCRDAVVPVGSVIWGASTMMVVIWSTRGLPAIVSDVWIVYCPGGGGAMMKL